MYMLYSLNQARPVSRHDETPGGGWALTAPQWNDVINYRDSLATTGFGTDSYDSFLNTQAVNCLVTQSPCLSNNLNPSRSGFYNGVIDYGFRFPIIKANPLTSQFLWDYLLMGQAYESLIVRDPTQIFTWMPHTALIAPSYTASTTGFDPTSLTSPDWADYGPAFGCPTTLCSYVRFRLPAEGTPGAPLWTNGDPFRAEDVQFSILYCQLATVGCFNFPSVQNVRSVLLQGTPNSDGSHNIITVELTKQSAWVRNDIGAGYLLVNHRAFGCAPDTGNPADSGVSYNPTTCYATPDSQFVWQTSANHVTLGPWVMSGTVSNTSPNFLYPNNPSTTITPGGTGSCPSTGCPGYYQEARLSGIDPDANRDGKINTVDFSGWSSHQGC